MKNVMGVIYTGEKDSFLRELTLLRAIAAMPVAGRYRVIDFLVSSMVGSGMRNAVSYTHLTLPTTPYV